MQDINNLKEEGRIRLLSKRILEHTFIYLFLGKIARLASDTKERDDASSRRERWTRRSVTERGPKCD